MHNFSINIKKTDRKKTVSFQVERGLVKVLVPKHLDKTKLDKYPSTATNGKILQGNGTTYVEIDTPTGTTNLNYTPSATDGTVTSSTGSSATIPLANGTNAGLLTAAEKTKITNTSGTNSGDETTATIKTKLVITTLSGSNTGDETTATIKTKLGITTLSGLNDAVLANDCTLSLIVSIPLSSLALIYR